jgi:hypothetical protein
VRRLALHIAACAFLLPAAAHAAACSPLDCAPSQFTLAHGTMLAVRGDVYKPLRVIDLRTGRTLWRLPPGIVTGDVLVHADGGLVTWFDAARGTRVGDATLQRLGRYSLVGTSQDGSRAVLARTQHRSTTFVILSRGSQRAVVLGGRNWEFDALRATKLFLIRMLRDGYQVRMYDLATNTLVPTPLKSPGESATIQGIPFERVASPDGRYLFTLYINGNGGAMIHQLDLGRGVARCIDLPGDGDFGSAITWGIAAAPDGRTLWAVSAGYGRVVAVDTTTHRVRDAYFFQRASWTRNDGVAVMSPDGARIAYTDAQHVWFVDLAARRVVAGPTHVAIALGYAPDGSRLWVVGQRSRVSALPAR